MKIKTVLFLLPIFFLLNGCSKGESGFNAMSAQAAFGSGSAVMEEGGFSAADASEEAARSRETARNETDDAVRSAEKTRKLVKTATVEIRADKSLLDEDGKIFGASKKIDELLNAHDAYSERSVIYENSLNYTIRVPQDSYEAMLSGLSVLGKVSSRAETVEDVTLNYYDLAGRLATKQALLQTFRSYLAKAQTMEDILSVETKIAELQNEIDWLGTELAGLSNLVDYATIHLILRSPQTSTGDTLGDRITDLFESFGDVASGALLVIVGIVIFGIPLIVVFLIVFWLLFGRIGLLKKAFRLAAGNSPYKTGLGIKSDFDTTIKKD
ncbi:MAG: DUF4349 domain-containing protein [Treponema sp.]|jgi:hypothetical protein|nr:DUF4349 domain-containing protein [Treponema sp.]